MLNINKKTKLSDAMKEYPGLKDYLVTLRPEYKLLENVTVRNLLAPRMDMVKIAKRGGMSVEELMDLLEAGAEEIMAGEPEDTAQAEQFKEEIKALMRRMNSGEDLEEIKVQFKELLKKVDPVLIAVAEAELTQEGYTIQDLMNACDVHLEFFAEGLAEAKVDVPEDHPLWRFSKDQEVILNWLQEARELVKEMAQFNSMEEAKELVARLKELMIKIDVTDNHDVRQENTLFPILEKYGVEEPPHIMWEEHVRMKGTRKGIKKALENPPAGWDYKRLVEYLDGLMITLVETFIQHSMKEHQILYPTALDLLSKEDWDDIAEESTELGYFELPEEVKKSE